MGIIGKSVSLTLLALLCFTSSVFTLGVNQPGSSAPFHSLPDHLTLPTPSPAKAPIKLPAFPPTKLPTLPPIKLPTLPPAKAPIKLPAFPPAKAPIKLPTLPPAKAPIKLPSLPPFSPPKFNRTLVAVRGLVYCKPCKYAGVSTLIGAKPVKDAVVRLVCKNKKSSITETKTDKNGYFMLLAPKTVTNYGIKACRAFLVKSPDVKCSKVSTLHGGDKGAYLKPVLIKSKQDPNLKKVINAWVIVNKNLYGLYNVGPFAFDPACPK